MYTPTINDINDLVKALETTLAALKDIVRQIPVNETLGDYRLDFCEYAEELATTTLNKLKSN